MVKRAFKERKIFKVAKDLNGDKTLGLDSFSIAFFQSCWNVIKEDAVKVFLKFHECGKFIRTLNATFNSLIPKKVWVGEVKPFVLLV